MNVCVGKLYCIFLLYRWNDIGNIAHNKSSIVLELINKEENVLFHTVRKRSNRCNQKATSIKKKPLKFHFAKRAHSPQPLSPKFTVYAESVMNFIELPVFVFSSKNPEGYCAGILSARN